MSDSSTRLGPWILALAALSVCLAACGNLRGGGGSNGGGAGSDFGSLTGHLTFTPPLVDAAIASVDAVGASGTTTPGAVAPNGDFVIYPLVAGTYSLSATCPGYTGSPIIGIAITAGADVQAPASITMVATTDGGGPANPGHLNDAG